MKLDTEFIRLPLAFDAERMRAEVLAVPEASWRPHPQGHPGNSALPLIAVGGDPLNDSTSGPMSPTPNLAACEYLQQVLSSFETVLGRARLMRLEGKSQATLHVDTNYYWAERVRIHVPILTSPEIEFICEDRSLHMPAGEAWIFDAWRRHNVLNPTGNQRIHLVADTVGSARFWDLVAQGERPFGEGTASAQPRTVEHHDGLRPSVALERSNFPAVMTPWEIRYLATEVILGDIKPGSGDPEALPTMRRVLQAFISDWRALWANFGGKPEGVEFHKLLLESLEKGLEALRGRLELVNGSDPVDIAHQMIIRSAINPQLFPAVAKQAAPDQGLSTGTVARTPHAAKRVPPPARELISADRSRSAPSRIERPIFIVAPPRSGTSLLFETLAQSPSVWTIGDESHIVIEGISSLHPAGQGWGSNRLGPSDATPAIREAIEARFLADLHDREGTPPPAEGKLRLLEKTPKNALRVPFLNALYPDAIFVYIYREPEESLSSMIAAWESGRFVTYPGLPGWEGKPWSLLLTPEWRSLAGKPLSEIVASQWSMTTQILLRDLGRIPPERWCVVGYHALLADPQGAINEICDFAGIDWDAELGDDLPLSRYTLTPPKADKWRRHSAELDGVLPGLQSLADQGRDLMAKPLRLKSRPENSSDTDSPFRSRSIGDLARVLEDVNSSVLLTTGKTGKVVCLRRIGGSTNTHLRALEAPMGLAVDGGRLAVGTKSQIHEYQNVPQILSKLHPPGRHDACFVPRNAHYTGDIGVHDLVYAGDEVWMVATRFSCLATLDGDHSFVPRWKPPFISEIAGDDRCHLNGLAVVDDEVAYVTALGATDEPDGWRENKASGGVLIDVESGETVISGLSMPHSPRWHAGRLWFLESGQGALCTIDLETGEPATVAKLPGFTRGLAFAGNLAFVGLSEVRESSKLGGPPLSGQLEESRCGLWIVNVETGKTVAALQFEDLVEEVFEVEILPGLVFPELAEHGSDAVNHAYVVPETIEI